MTNVFGGDRRPATVHGGAPATAKGKAEWLIHNMLDGESAYPRPCTSNQARVRTHDSAGNRLLELIERSCPTISLMRFEEG
jgi:hypothetical protein